MEGVPTHVLLGKKKRERHQTNYQRYYHNYFIQPRSLQSAAENMYSSVCSPWGRWGSDTTERLHFHFSLSCIGEGSGNPLQCSCLENPRDGGAWWAAVYGVAQSRTRLKRLSSSSITKEGGIFPHLLAIHVHYWVKCLLIYFAHFSADLLEVILFLNIFA